MKPQPATYFALICLLLVPFQLRAQSAQVPDTSKVQRCTIIGRVTDGSTDQPLQGANVVVIGRTWGARTDQLGQFIIQGITPGKYTLKASYVDYISIQQNDVGVAGGENTVVDFTLVALAAWQQLSCSALSN